MPKIQTKHRDTVCFRSLGCKTRRMEVSNQIPVLVVRFGLDENKNIEISMSQSVAVQLAYQVLRQMQLRPATDLSTKDTIFDGRSNKNVRRGFGLASAHPVNHITDCRDDAAG